MGLCDGRIAIVTGAGPEHEPVDDPTRLGPIVEELLGRARPNSGMNGRTGAYPQTLLNQKS